MQTDVMKHDGWVFKHRYKTAKKVFENGSENVMEYHIAISEWIKKNSFFFRTWRFMARSEWEVNPNGLAS